MLSDELTNLREMFLGKDEWVQLAPETCAGLAAILRDCAEQARALERLAVPAPARLVPERRKPRGNIVFPDFCRPPGQDGRP